MRSSRIFSFVLFVIALLVFTILHTPQTGEARSGSSDLSNLQYAAKFDKLSSILFSYHGVVSNRDVSNKKLSSDKQGGIKEDIPNKYKAEYLGWKEQFLSTETGKQQWEAFENDTEFTLTITVSAENSKGASTGKYKWDSSGKLIAATISLGNHLNEGYPNPIYYPVLNSLTLPEEKSAKEIDGDILAATKIAHEFGHVKRTAISDSALYQLQGELIPKYVQIFLSNGRKVDDPRLTDLVRQMQGTPIEIWEDREYWGETNAMLYVRDKFTNKDMRCSLFNKIKQSVDLYAKNYYDRFFEIAQSTSSSDCGW